MKLMKKCVCGVGIEFTEKEIKKEKRYVNVLVNDYITGFHASMDEFNKIDIKRIKCPVCGHIIGLDSRHCGIYIKKGNKYIKKEY